MLTLILAYQHSVKAFLLTRYDQLFCLKSEGHLTQKEVIRIRDETEWVKGTIES